MTSLLKQLSKTLHATQQQLQETLNQSDLGKAAADKVNAIKSHELYQDLHKQTKEWQNKTQQEFDELKQSLLNVEKEKRDKLNNNMAEAQKLQSHHIFDSAMAPKQMTNETEQNAKLDTTQRAFAMAQEQQKTTDDMLMGGTYYHGSQSMKNLMEKSKPVYETDHELLMQGVDVIKSNSSRFAVADGVIQPNEQHIATHVPTDDEITNHENHVNKEPDLTQKLAAGAEKLFGTIKQEGLSLKERLQNAWEEANKPDVPQENNTQTVSESQTEKTLEGVVAPNANLNNVKQEDADAMVLNLLNNAMQDKTESIDLAELLRDKNTLEERIGNHQIVVEKDSPYTHEMKIQPATIAKEDENQLAGLIRYVKNLNRQHLTDLTLKLMGVQNKQFSGSPFEMMVQKSMMTLSNMSILAIALFLVRMLLRAYGLKFVLAATIGSHFLLKKAKRALSDNEETEGGKERAAAERFLKEQEKMQSLNESSNEKEQ